MQAHLALETAQLNKTRQQELQRLETLYNLHESEELIAAEKANSQFKDTLLVLLLTLLVLSLALAYVTWRFLKANKKANARLKQVNQLLWERSNARANQIVKLAHYNAHEVRGPLARIQGLVNVMRSEGSRTPELSGNLEMLETSAHDLDQVIQRMNEIIHKGPPAVERLTTAENP